MWRVGGDGEVVTGWQSVADDKFLATVGEVRRHGLIITVAAGPLFPCPKLPPPCNWEIWRRSRGVAPLAGWISKIFRGAVIGSMAEASGFASGAGR